MKGTDFFLLVWLPVCFLSQEVHSTSTARLGKQVDFGAPTPTNIFTYFFLVSNRRKKPSQALILEPQMAGWLRGLDFIKELTLIITSCLKKKVFHSLCTCYVYIQNRFKSLHPLFSRNQVFKTDLFIVFTSFLFLVFLSGICVSGCFSLKS